MTFLSRLFRPTPRDLDTLPVDRATSITIRDARSLLAVAVELGELTTRPNKDGLPCTITAAQDARLRQLDLSFGMWLQQLGLDAVFQPLVPKRGDPADMESLQGRWELLPNCKLLVWKRPATYKKGVGFDLADETAVNATDEWQAAMRALIGVVEGMANMKIERIPG